MRVGIEAIICKVALTASSIWIRNNSKSLLAHGYVKLYYNNERSTKTNRIVYPNMKYK